MRWLNSGLRRDVCVLLAGESYRRQQLKVALEDRYGDRVDADRFRRALERLIDAGFVEREVDGIHDVYALTDAGREGVEAQFEWMREQL
ncbi:multidrug DMT transporter permease [Halobacteriales archaeon QS_7_69_60]|nr:MAG: multidrug DMT transporter permease [Halobacteriales archaeon QS_7_69_60]